MSESFIGEIRLFGFNFAPKNWAFCNGQLLPIAQNTALFSLLGTTYGGNGQTTFALPNLQGRVPVHQGQGPGLAPYTQGEVGGQETQTLTVAQIPQHTHSVGCQPEDGNLGVPTGNFPAPVANGYSATKSGVMNAGVVSLVGGSQPHNNLPPYLVMNFCITLFGIFPSRN